ncbi:hypothetical protein PRECH8_04030 [Insulibacter thermoxylanivorax]|uniref:ABC-type glycine betaine transport system substrate-binding domain-containing protein n=1 Tax=Insulibacter thermoxylanivorax TaxID=2749268 RepID=A0A916QEW9_9BACL|nr:glycine betaine ABC transporter substrate-binding protein [Insulibacter thermoxylanivorax]GFR37107.1 hypothetical protein PRECH8_04030 [Insulibacter thermoxylanivorax]
MKRFKTNLWFIGITLILSLALAGCTGTSNDVGSNNGANQGNAKGGKEITLVYVAWDSEIASTNVVKTVLEERLGYKVNILQVDNGPMWQGVAAGSADAMVAAWLPGTHGNYYEELKDDFVDLGPNLEGAAIGLVVPSYVDVNSIEELADPDVAAQFNGEIIGIESGAGVMLTTEKAIEEYGLDLNLVASSSAAMAQVLQEDYEAGKPIVVTGWTPHWMFAAMDLKYLEDPKKVYGDAENIHTIVRHGLQEDMPDAYAFLDKFYWTPEDMAEVMIQIADGADPAEAAKAWVDANPDKVDAWLE